MNWTTLGRDVTKQVFQLRAVDERGQVVIHKRMSRGKVRETVAQLPPGLGGQKTSRQSRIYVCT
jgi:hypothetical protein